MLTLLVSFLFSFLKWKYNYVSFDYLSKHTNSWEVNNNMRAVKYFNVGSYLLVNHVQTEPNLYMPLYTSTLFYCEFVNEIKFDFTSLIVSYAFHPNLIGAFLLGTKLINYSIK